MISSNLIEVIDLEMARLAQIKKILQEPLIKGQAPTPTNGSKATAKAAQDVAVAPAPKKRRKMSKEARERIGKAVRAAAAARKKAAAK